MPENGHKVKVTLETLKCGTPGCECTQDSTQEFEGTVEEVVNAVNTASEERDDAIIAYALGLEKSVVEAVQILQDRIERLENPNSPGGFSGFHNGNPTLN